ALQAAGFYASTDARVSALRSIDLHPDGTYAAIWNSGFHQSGHFSGATGFPNPLPLTMRSGSHSWAAQVNVVSGVLTTGSSQSFSRMRARVKHGSWACGKHSKRSR